MVVRHFLSDPRLGVVYTRAELVSFALDLAHYTPDRDLTETRVLDVGCGYGQFIGEVSKRLVASCQSRGLDVGRALRVMRRCLRGVEINPETAEKTRDTILQTVEGAYGPSSGGLALVESVVREADFLEDTESIEEFDCVVGNLPYVRYDSISDLPTEKDQNWLRDRFACFRGRADYSVAMLEKCLEVLSEGGEAALVCSNRFTRAEYGKELRKVIADKGLEVHEIDLSGVAAFDDDVEAYSSLFLLQRGKPGYSRYIKLRSLSDKCLAHLTKLGPRRVRSTRWYTSCTRERTHRDGRPWAPLPRGVVRILMRLDETYASAEEQGVFIRKGPATGRDQVYVRRYEDFPFSESSKSEFLLPLFRSGSCKLKEDDIPDRFLLSVYEAGSRRLLTLDEMPGDVQEYLRSHRQDLERRHIVSSLGRPWWGTIDSFDPGLKHQTKALIPDLQRGLAVRIDRGRLFPAHSVVYALAPGDAIAEFATVVKSPMADLYRIWHSPSMRGGTPRASSKVLSRLPCPDLRELDGYSRAHPGFERVYSAYGLQDHEVSLIERTHARVFRSTQFITPTPDLTAEPLKMGTETA